MRNINSYAANSNLGPLKSFEFSLPDIGPDQVDIKVKYCGVCHSDRNTIR